MASVRAVPGGWRAEPGNNNKKVEPKLSFFTGVDYPSTMTERVKCKVEGEWECRCGYRPVQTGMSTVMTRA